MLDKNTPPLSPEMNDPTSEEDMIVEVEDVEEIIDLEESNINDVESENESDNDSMKEDSQKEDAVYIFRGHTPTHSVFCCSLSKNGELAATGSEEDKAYLWNTITGEIILECTGHNDSVITVEFNYNDTYLATADMSGIIKVWQINNKACIWETGLADITWVKWHKSANILLVGMELGEVYMLKIPEGTQKVFAQGLGFKAASGIILPDGKRAAVGYSDGTIRILDLKMNTILFTISSDSTQSRGHSNTVCTLDCHMDNNLLISGSITGEVILSTTHNGKIISILQNLNSFKDSVGTSEKDNINTVSVESVAFCKDPTFPVAASGTIEKNHCGKIYIWDISRQVLRHKIDQEGGITKLVWASGSILFTTGIDGILRCFDARAGCYLRSFLGHKAVILDLDISEDAKKALTVSDDATARIFDISFMC